MRIELKVLSPERELLSCQVEQVELPGMLGRFVVQENHAPILSALSAGVIRYRIDGTDRDLPVSSGFVKVKDNVVTACVE
ncbi:MAG: F0F1 ATP synthase subunit epsilon [Bacteroidales bacterium]|nr:F0F1 ATP synthase subunit epsilon [Bacteroidales bacterium]